jgi:hypothetical protein
MITAENFQLKEDRIAFTYKLNPHSLAKHNSMITITIQRNGTSQIQKTVHER